MDQDLPEFRSHGFDSKFVPLTEAEFAPTPHLKRLITYIETWTHAPLEGLTILDVGCGRGDLVAALRARGARAFGCEIDPRFVESGQVLSRHYSDEHPILSVVGETVFPDGFFDLVISDQVLEHVADLDGFAQEMTRVLKPGGHMIHQFPARFCPVEPHYYLPMVHWLPKTDLRLNAIKALLALGLSRQFFPDLDLDARAKVIFRYSAEETFYRPIEQISAAFKANGIAPTFSEGLRALAARKLGRHHPLVAPVAHMMGVFKMAIWTGRKPALAH